MVIALRNLCIVMKTVVTVEPQFNKHLGNNEQYFRPGKSYSKMYGTEPQFKKPRFNELLDLTSRFRQPKLKINLNALWHKISVVYGLLLFNR